MIWRWGRDEEPDAAEPPDAPDAPVGDGERSRRRVRSHPEEDSWEVTASPDTDDPRPLATTHGVADVAPGDLAVATRRVVTRALAEDLGDRGDVTSLACVPPLASGVAHVVAREPGTVAGTAAFVETFAQVDPQLDVELRVADGDRVESGDVVAEVRGRLRAILTAERTALNLLGRLSGVATTTRAYVDAVDGTGCAIRDTRKTTPGLRLLEKAAVAAGGGTNHRIGLYDALLVKDNHIAAAGGVDAAARAALDRAGGRPVQVEVTGIDELEQALSAGVTDVLADNLDPDGLRRLVVRASGRAAVEASGGITLDTVRAYAETGVDRIAVGTLTHSAATLDIALDVVDEDVVDGDVADGDVPDGDVVEGHASAGRTRTDGGAVADDRPALETELFGDEADARRPEA